jgi:hypothetical protein
MIRGWTNCLHVREYLVNNKNQHMEVRVMKSEFITNNIIPKAGRSFKQFADKLTEGVSVPEAKFIRDILCGIIFSRDLILTHVGSSVPDGRSIAATAKRFRRHLVSEGTVVRPELGNYWSYLRSRLKTGCLFTVDITDLSKPRARKLEYLAYVHDGDKDTIVPGYWCLEICVLDKDGILWPVVFLPFSVQTELTTTFPLTVMRMLSELDEYFGDLHGVYVFDRGFDSRGYMETFCGDSRHFVIRQRGDRDVILPNGTRIKISHLVDKLFTDRRNRIVYQKVYLHKLNTPLYVVAFHRY